MLGRLKQNASMDIQSWPEFKKMMDGRELQRLIIRGQEEPRALLAPIHRTRRNYIASLIGGR